MKIIDKYLVEETWQEVAMYNAKKMVREGKRMAKTRPDLVGFVAEFCRELNRDAQELAMYIAYVVFMMFEKAGYDCKVISPERIVKMFEANLEWAEKMTVIDERFLERRIQNRKEFMQKNIFQYVVDTLYIFENDVDEDYHGENMNEYDDGVHITKEEKGYVFLVIKTIIDSYEIAVTKSRSKRKPRT